MMKEIKNNTDDPLKGLFSGMKMKAGDNLKFRIMQQIETEKVLSGKKEKGSFSILNNMISVFGTMYAILGLVVAGIYFSFGKESLVSPSTLFVILMIVFAFSMFWMISMFDEKRRMKKTKNKQ